MENAHDADAQNIGLIVEQYEESRLVARLSDVFARQDSVTRAEYEAIISDLRTTLFEPGPWETTR